MRIPFILLFLIFQMLTGVTAKAQYRFLTEAPAPERLKVLWQYCTYNLISDKDSAATCQFLSGVAHIADSLNDARLKRYATYFRMCSRLLFSINYRQYFAPGDYETPTGILQKTRAWALKNGYTDIAAACEHNIGQVYYSAARFGPAFEHLLKADEEFGEIGYENVPDIAVYLYEFALHYYEFEEWDKALYYFVEASHYAFYIPWAELANLEAIGRIYARKGAWDKAEAFYRKTIARAKMYKDDAWVGIASGSLGNVFLTKGQNDSALFYHRRNYIVNISDRAPEDAAKSALGMATIFIRQQHLDSALHYIRSGRELARKYIPDSAQQLEYQKNLLIVMIELNKAKEDYKAALHFSDSLTIIKDVLQQKLDIKLLNRAVEKTEAQRHQAELKLLQSQKSLSRLRYSVLIAVLLCLMIIAALLFNRYRLKKLHQMELAAIEKKETEQKLKQAEELLKAYLNIIREKTFLIENLDTELHRLKEGNNNVPDFESLAVNRERLISSTILTDDDWRHFRSLFEQVHPGFLLRLWEKFPDLSPAEMRLLILTRLNLSAREMANMLGISVDAIRKSRYRVRKKLNLEEESNLEVLIQQI